MKRLFWELKIYLSFILAAATPIIFYSLSVNGPDWYVDNGWSIVGPDKSDCHTPSFISCILFFILFSLSGICHICEGPPKSYNG